jgi:hypothetical protein
MAQQGAPFEGAHAIGTKSCLQLANEVGEEFLRHPSGKVLAEPAP